ncbi:hypothetical protein D9615_003859 [Tricholomella constricta]|uniref:Uncharacterized protein n=1 Tax=Tricholomella constricta TaxID=117010 RepID=A0A8H5HD46_9AGAR|nr:hypothetical protein D9615_003859 [Tricholomella constricta]
MSNKNRKKTSKPKSSDRIRSSSVAPDNPREPDDNPSGSGVAEIGGNNEVPRDVATTTLDDDYHHQEDERSSGRPQSAVLATARITPIVETIEKLESSDRKALTSELRGQDSDEKGGVFPHPFDNISRKSVKMRDDEHRHTAIFGESELTDLPDSRSSKTMSTATRRKRRADKKPMKEETRSPRVPPSTAVDDKDLLIESIVLGVRMLSRDGLMPARETLVELVNDAFVKCVGMSDSETAIGHYRELVVENIVLQLRTGGKTGVTPPREELVKRVTSGIRECASGLADSAVNAPRLSSRGERGTEPLPLSTDTMEVVNQSLRKPRQIDETSSQARTRHAAYERAMNPPQAGQTTTSASRTMELSGAGPTSYRRGPSCDDEIVTHWGTPEGTRNEQVQWTRRGSAQISLDTTRPRQGTGSVNNHVPDEDEEVSDSEEEGESESEVDERNDYDRRSAQGRRSTTRSVQGGIPRPGSGRGIQAGATVRAPQNPTQSLTSPQPQYYGSVRLPSRTPGAAPAETQRTRDAASRPVRSFGSGGLQRQGDYLRKVHGRYHATIDEKLESPIALPQGIKPGGLRVPMPDYYGGTPSMEVFDAWLYGLLRWMEISQLGGDERERERISYTGMYLKGPAAVWFTDNVDGINRRRWEWSLKDVITGLYDRFIHEASLQDAYVGFEGATYNNEGGISEFFHQLKRYAERMAMQPDPYTFKRRFLLGIPRYLRKEILSRGFTAETSRMSEILEAGMKVEQANRVLRGYDEYESSIKKTQIKWEPPSPKTTGKPDTGGRGAYRATQGGGQKVEPRMDNKEKKPSVTAGKDTGGDTKSPAEKRLACFECGSLEHFARSRKCPKNKAHTARLNAVRDIVDDTSDTEEAEDSHCERHSCDRPPGRSLGTVQEEPEEEETPLIGEQYESEGEDYALEQYEEYDTEDGGCTVERLCYGRAVIEEEEDDGLPLLVEVSDSESEDEGESAQVFAARTEMGPGAGLHPIVVKKSTRLLKRPTRKATERQCFTALVEINGLKAFTLFDSGCTAEAVSPEFARVANMKVHQLKEVVPLQLGTKGSRSVINYGTSVPLRYEAVDVQVYFDIVNLDKYDAIIGVALMRQLDIELDFRHNCVRVAGIPAPTFTVEEETREMARRSALRRSDAGHSHE